MRRVYKYPIQVADHQRITLPKGAGIIHADTQEVPQPGVVHSSGWSHRSLFLWAIIDDEQQEKVDLDIYVAETGHPLPFLSGPHSANFLRTVMDREYVWHIFYRTAAKTLAAEAMEGLTG